MNRFRLFTLTLILGAAAGACTAADTPPSGGASGGRPPGPPPEAVAACSGKTAGTTVSFSGRNGESFSGTCELTDGKLAARPANMQRPQQQR